MKDITIKILLSFYVFFMFTSCEAKVFTALDEFFNKHAGKEKVVANKPSKKHKLLKNKEGKIILPWEFLQSEYNLQTGKQGKELGKIIGKDVVIKGFMLPLDFSAKRVKEFLIIPYIPTCAHVPPPPPNMTINASVLGKNVVKPSYLPVEVVGTLSIAKPSKKQKNAYIENGIYSLGVKAIREVSQ